MSRSNRKKWFFVLLIALALIILPTGPEDLVTIPLLISMLGFWGYLLLALIILLLVLLLLPKRYRRRLHL